MSAKYFVQQYYDYIRILLTNLLVYIYKRARFVDTIAYQ